MSPRIKQNQKLAGKISGQNHEIAETPAISCPYSRIQFITKSICQIIQCFPTNDKDHCDDQIRQKQAARQ